MYIYFLAEYPTYDNKTIIIPHSKDKAYYESRYCKAENNKELQECRLYWKKRFNVDRLVVLRQGEEIII